MLIAGLQKLSLVDYPGKLACVVFTGGCNLRCPYCHNSELLQVPEPLMTEEAFLDFLCSRKGKLEGVCITGGEPCLQKDLRAFIQGIREVGFPVKLDTNGFYPERLQELLREGLLDYVAVDVKNAPDDYARTVGLESCSTESLLMTIDLLMKAGISYELRTTVVDVFHSLKSFEGICRALSPLVEKNGKKIARYYLQSFVDRDTVPYAGLKPPTEEQLQAGQKILKKIAECVEIR